MFMNNMPKASPNHQTNSDQAKLTASAGLTVGRYSRPNPIAIWTRAKSVLKTPR